MTDEFARGYEECRSDLTAWSKARAKATGDRISLDLIHEFYVFMAQREFECPATIRTVH